MKNNIITSIFCLLAIHMMAQSITPRPDSSFNQTGLVTLDALAFFEPNLIAQQSDGKVLVGGYGLNNINADYDGILYRVNADGSIDHSFGNAGLLQLDVDGGHDNLAGLLVLPDNKILLLLESAFRSVLIRLNPNGTYDTSYGNDGFILVPTLEFEYTKKLVLQPDQKLLILSESRTQSNQIIATVRRCSMDGELDPSYGSNGRVQVAIDLINNFSPSDAILQPDGKLVFTGNFGYLSTSGFPVVRLNTNGSLDNTFSNDGIYVKTLGDATFTAVAYSIALGLDGKIYVSGETANLGVYPMSVMCLNPNGSVNGSFGTFGVVKIPIGGYSSARKIITQPDGKLLLGGFGFTAPTQTNFALVRISATGIPDLSFGNQQGRLVIPYTGADPYELQIFSNMTLAPNGQLLVAAWLGQTLNLGANNFTATAVYRFITDITVKANEPSKTFQNAQISPNPVVNDLLQLQYDLAQDAAVSLRVYNESGQQLHVLSSGIELAAGPQTASFPLPSDLPSGVYYLEISSEKESKILKFLKQ